MSDVTGRRASGRGDVGFVSRDWASRLVPVFRASWLVFLVPLVACADQSLAPKEEDPPTDEWAFDSTYQFVYPDPNADPRTPYEPPPPPQEIDGLMYQARTTVRDTAVGAAESMAIGIEVTVQNPTADSVELTVQCHPVRLRAYAEPVRSEPPVWRVVVFECLTPPTTHTLEPGGTAMFGAGSRDVHLVDLPDGRYYWSADFLRAEDTLRLAAGSGDVWLRIPGLAYRVRLRRNDDYFADGVEVRVGVTNHNDVAIRLVGGYRLLFLRLYGDADRTDRVYDWLPADLCARVEIWTDVAPGETVWPGHFWWVFNRVRPHQDSVAAGEYHLSVLLHHNWRWYEFPAATITLP